MANQTEFRMIEVIKKFIIYMLTENTNCVSFGKTGEVFTCGNEIIYSKLNELDGEELEDWVNDKLKPYLSNGCEYTEGDIEIGNCEIQHNWTDIDYDNIFTNCGELMDIQRTLIDYDIDKFEGDCDCIKRLTYNEDLLQYYCNMYINEMDATYLKEYIIFLLDPIEPK